MLVQSRLVKITSLCQSSCNSSLSQGDKTVNVILTKTVTILSFMGLQQLHCYNLLWMHNRCMAASITYLHAAEQQLQAQKKRLCSCKHNYKDSVWNLLFFSKPLYNMHLQLYCFAYTRLDTYLPKKGLLLLYQHQQPVKITDLSLPNRQISRPQEIIAVQLL